MWSDPLLRQILLAAILAMTVGYGAMAWIPSYLMRSHGLNIAQAGVYLALVIGIGGAVGSWLGGYLSDRLRNRDGPLAVGMMSQIVFAQYGEDSLRYALLVWQFVAFWAAIHFFLAGGRLAAYFAWGCFRDSCRALR